MPPTDVTAQSVPADRAPTISYSEFVAITALLMALNAAAIDIYIPAMQQIGDALGVSDANDRQFVITTYVVFFGASQLLYGVLSDHFGRRPVLFAGLAIYIGASVAAVFAPSFAWLLVFRALQGVGAGATRVIALSVVRDRFEGAAMARVMSLVMMIFLIVPVFAPNLGTLILLVADWRALSGFMCAFGVAALVWSYLRLPETRPEEHKRPLAVWPVIEAFRQVFAARSAFGYTLAVSVMLGVIFGFIAQAEQIFKEVYGIGPLFTLWFAVIAAFMSAANFLNSKLVDRVGVRRLAHLTLGGFLAVTATHLVLALAMGGATPFWVFMTLGVPMFALFGFVPSNFNTLAMEPLGQVAGTASSVLGAMQMLFGGLFGGLIAYLFDGTLIPMLAGFTGLAVAAALFVWWVETAGETE